jgi:hypothetical protein
LYINVGPDETSEYDQGHPFNGYYLPYPESEYEGLVSTITNEAPILNWIYVDTQTYEVKYGVRDFAQPHLTGPFDCTRQDRRLTLEGWEGFVAVEELPGIWALYFDRDDNGLKGKVALGTRVLEIELIRREKKIEKPAPEAGQQTLEDKMMALKEQKADDVECPRTSPPATPHPRASRSPSSSRSFDEPSIFDEADRSSESHLSFEMTEEHPSIEGQS